MTLRHLSAQNNLWQIEAHKCYCRSQEQENLSADRIAELERQLAEARSGKDTEMTDENTRIVKMLADVSFAAHNTLAPRQSI